MCLCYAAHWITARKLALLTVRTVFDGNSWGGKPQRHPDPRVARPLRHRVPQSRANPPRRRMAGGEVDFADALFGGMGERALEQQAGAALAAVGGQDAGAEFGDPAVDREVDETGKLAVRLDEGEAVVLHEVDARDVGGDAGVGQRAGEAAVAVVPAQGQQVT